METQKTKGDGERILSRECLPLIQSAHIEIYRKNIFRLTFLSIDASEKEIKKHAEKLKTQVELGYGEGANPPSFALDKPPSVDQIRDAMQRLKEPELRLVDEFFWFWPREFGKSANDSAIQAILSGDSKSAFDIWTRLETSPEHDYIAWHNIAVMYHLSALDWTLDHIKSKVDIKEEEKIWSYWKESFERWEKIATDDRIWDALKARIRVLDDPRLTTGFARRMRLGFPDALDKINAEVALKFAEQGAMKWAKIHIGFMNETHQGLDDVEKTAELVLNPTRNRVLQHIKTAKEETKKNPKNGADAARKLMEQSSPLQSLFELFHGSDSHHKTELFDDVATTVINCAAEFQKKTNDNGTFVELLKECLQFATGMDVRQRIQKNIDIGEGNLRHIALESFFAELKKIQESKEKAKTRFDLVKQKGMPFLLRNAEDKTNQDLDFSKIADVLAILLKNIAADANNNENDYHTAAKAIRIAYKLAQDTHLKQKIKKFLKEYEKDEKDATCFYCASNPVDSNENRLINMYRIIEQTDDGLIKYEKQIILIPCCSKCIAKHGKKEITGFLLFAGSTILGIGLGIKAGGHAWVVFGVVGFAIGLFLAFLGASVMEEIYGLKSDDKYFRIQENQLLGWRIGEKPPTR